VRRRRHHDHRLETTTDVRVRRLRVAAGERYVAFGWDYPGSTLLEVRILRSTRGFAAGPGPSTEQHLVYDDVSGSFRDTGLERGVRYYYTVFARHPGGEWVRWGESCVRPGARRAARLRRLLPWAAVVLVLVVALGAAATAAAQEGDEAPVDEPTAAEAALEEAARADPRVAAILAGVEAEATVTTETGPLSPLGGGVTFMWSPEQSRPTTVEWPVLDRAAAETEPETRRLKFEELTGMAVVVDGESGAVREIYPAGGTAAYVIRQDTTSPWSDLPWLVDQPWLPLPLFMAVAAGMAIHAFVRSRAWRRRTPSMARHDRQALGRLAVIVVLIAGFVAQVWVVVAAAQEELPYDRPFDPGSLQVLPVLLFPAALYLAALVLELLTMPHRGSWGLVAVMAAGTYVYSVIVMMRVATDDVSLVLSLLLGALMLLSLPRAFGAGRMGWSRSATFSRS
jgi:hypothetical protein